MVRPHGKQRTRTTAMSFPPTTPSQAANPPHEPNRTDGTLPRLHPMDEHNRRLLDQVHPAGWTNPTPRGRYNLVVIGAGTAGLVTAVVAAGMGATVALIERHLMGGDCLTVGCVPSKALLRSARAWAEVQRAEDFGIRVPPGAQVDFAAVMARLRRLRADLSPIDSAQRYAGLGVDVYFGQAQFADQDTVIVEGRDGQRRLPFVNAVLCTGARAAVPDIPGLHGVPYLTNETLFDLTERPPRLTVLGAGPIGCEMAQAFARCGTTVTLIETHQGLLPKEDRDAAAIVQQRLQRDGVRMLFGAKVLRVEAVNHGHRAIVQSEGAERIVEGEALLVAAGRAPNVEGLGLERVGVAADRHGITVNDRLQSTNPRIFAAGDVCSRYKFTHAADAMAKIVIQNALFPHPFGLGYAQASSLVMPWATYTEPEIAHVGLYAAEAREKGFEVDTYTVPFEEVDRAVLDSASDGFARLHVRRGTETIVGATMVGPHAGDLISEVSVLVNVPGGVKRLATTIHPYPTQADAWRKAATLWRKAQFTPRTKAWLTRLFAWRRS